MKQQKYYVVIKPQERNGRKETVFPVITPTGEIYCAFTLGDAVKFKGEAMMYRKKR